jgi:HSP20 family protein
MSLISSLINPSNGACAEGGQCQARRPRFEVENTDGAYGLTVFLPGVSKAGLEITDDEGELRITGKPGPALPEGSVVLHRETSEVPYELVLAHDSSVDTAKVEAELKDGVLRLSIAKAESAKPRKITVS